MTDMTLTQVRDELRSRGIEGAMQPSYEFCDELADAIDAHLAKAAQGEAVAGDGVDYLHALDQADIALGIAGLAEDDIFRVELRRAREHFAATKRPVGVPEGYRLVPVESTDDMCRNAREKIGIGSNVAHHVWHWMIAAAPDGDGVS